MINSSDIAKAIESSSFPYLKSVTLMWIILIHPTSLMPFFDFWAAYTYTFDATVLVSSYAYNNIYDYDCAPFPKATELRCSFQDEERNEVGSCRGALAYLRIQTCASPKMGMLVRYIS